jgi:hypothetical protein
MNGIGDKYQQETKYEPDRMPGHRLVWESKPDVYKEYPEVQKIELATFEPSQPMSLDRALRQRKSIRDFQAKAISQGRLSYLLWASTGIRKFPSNCILRSSLKSR